VLAAVAQNGNALLSASVALRNDREVVLAAVAQNGLVLRWAPEALKNDRAFVLAAVAQNGEVLGHVHDALVEDREVLLAAVTQNGLALRYAWRWAALKNDREVVLAAVAQNGKALEYASEALQNDFRVRLAAATSHRSPNLAAMGAALNDIERELKVLLPKTVVDETDEMRSSRMDRLEAYSVVLGRLSAVKVQPNGPLDLKLQGLVELLHHPQNGMHVRPYKRDFKDLAGDEDGVRPSKQLRAEAEAHALSTGQSMRRACVFLGA